ncbi:MAG: valine--tRNA ligase [Rhodobacteraceae bacterium]|nr:valine--tRNA ligase [Paracoccaceae bacterium]
MPLDKTFDTAKAEPRIYQQWEEAQCFAAGRNAAKNAQPYCIMIPPPNVTGVLHIGHAFNNTLQDILIRRRRMQGWNTLWQPGVDHAGIATQMVVERHLAQAGRPSRHDMGRAAFLDEVWAWKEHSGNRIVEQLKRLGASCDFSRTAFTMAGAQGDTRVGHENSPNFHDAVIRVFVEMYDAGLIYRDKRLVNWDPHFETAISDLEVENRETPGHMWHFKYPLAGGITYTYVERDAQGKVVLEESRDYISIATTRPETMLGDGAVAVHPSDARYAPIVGQLCEIPVGPKAQRRLIPIITDAYPDPDFGSGAVKITGAHDFNDYAVARRAGIPLYRLMDTRARMRSDGVPYTEAVAKAQQLGAGAPMQEVDSLNLVPDDLRGLDRFEARKRVVEQITAEGLAVMIKGEGALRPLVESRPIMQPFGDRSGVVIEPMLTDQWFVDSAKLVAPAVQAVRSKAIGVFPESGEKVFYHWMKTIEPWCISRQLWWGHRIPVWYDGQGHQFCATTALGAYEKAAQFHRTQGARAALEQVRAAQGEDSGLGDAHPGKLWRDADVLDTWFSSALWPLGTLGWPDDFDKMRAYYPTSILVTGQDILFFWVARMIMLQLHLIGEIPFKQVYLHGLVRDGKGRKMSKSAGNVVDPLQIIDSYGADALRFANAAMASLGGALRLDTQRIKGYRNFSTKLWNAARFAEANGATGYDFAGRAAPVPARVLNRWIMGETAKLRVKVDSALDALRFNDAAAALHGFVWGTFCDWYVEFTKPIFAGTDTDAIAETRESLAWVLDQCLRLLHPVMPFITEELWRLTAPVAGRTRMLALSDWPDCAPAALVDSAADQQMTWVIALIEAIRSARVQMGVPAGAVLPMLVADIANTDRANLAANEALIFRLARIKSLQEVESFPKGCLTITLGEASFGLPLAGVIDVAAEKRRLQKTLTQREREIDKLQSRLGNREFLAEAPQDVVARTREALSLREGEITKLRAALARLSNLEA